MGFHRGLTELYSVSVKQCSYYMLLTGGHSTPYPEGRVSKEEASEQANQTLTPRL